MTDYRKNLVEQDVALNWGDVEFTGLDMSLTKSGVAQLSYGCLRTWSWVPGDRLKGFDRLLWYNDRLSEVLTYSSIVTLEDYAFSRGFQAHQLGELGGLVRMRLWREGVRSYVATPQVIKKFATGKGNAGKPAVVLGLFKRWGLMIENEDQADAAAACLSGAYRFSESVDELTKPQREAVASLRPFSDGVRRRQKLSPGTKKG